METGWVHAGAGETVVLVCRVYSNPVATVTWYKHTMKLIQGDRISTQQVAWRASAHIQQFDLHYALRCRWGTRIS